MSSDITQMPWLSPGHRWAAYSDPYTDPLDGFGGSFSAERGGKGRKDR